MATLKSAALNRLTATTLIAALGATGLPGCGVSSVRVDYVETDTYISTLDASNHSELASVRVSRTASAEERVLIKLPTGSREVDTRLESIFDNPENIALAPFLILVEIFASFFNCQGKALAPYLLNNARLVLDVTQNDGGGSLANQIQLELLGKPWWQTASWNLAHGFSRAGAWLQPGGDTDATFAPLQAAVSGSTIEFDVTDYFRTLLGTEKPHYGMLLRSSGATLAAVALASTQYGVVTQRPRLVSTYNCITPGTALREAPEPKEFTYILGK